MANRKEITCKRGSGLKKRKFEWFDRCVGGASSLHTACKIVWHWGIQRLLLPRKYRRRKQYFIPNMSIGAFWHKNVLLFSLRTSFHCDNIRNYTIGNILTQTGTALRHANSHPQPSANLSQAVTPSYLSNVLRAISNEAASFVSSSLAKSVVCKISTAQRGVDVLGCAAHRLICKRPKKIALCNKITHNAFRISNFSYELLFVCSPYESNFFPYSPSPIPSSENR